MPGALGRRIHESICRPCWDEWFAMSIRVINEYRLNLVVPEAGAVYDRCLREFLGLKEEAPKAS
jgi:Fe-S cluster biosynthesis and repair protein YggX